jgi:hypothetical protein
VTPIQRNQKWRKANPEKVKAIRRAWLDKNPGYLGPARQAKVDFANNLRSATPCADCLNYFHFVAMDFDHRPGETKVEEVMAMIANSKPMERILTEIAKCDIVCANCHRIRTWRRQPVRFK